VGSNERRHDAVKTGCDVGNSVLVATLRRSPNLETLESARLEAEFAISFSLLVIERNICSVTEGEELGRKEKLKSKWAALEALVGSDRRLSLIAKDIVEHFEKRLEALDGKVHGRLYEPAHLCRALQSAHRRATWLALRR